jgi:hypothetical protein
VVVAIRYLQTKGVSHAHLYLFRGDGTLVRQLTRSDAGQDHDPVFSPDGRRIVFERRVRRKEQFWSISPSGSDLRQLGAAPIWYAESGEELAFFSRRAAVPSPYNPTAFDAVPSGPNGPLQYTAPDTSAELDLVHPAKEQEEQEEWEKRGRLFLVRDSQGGNEYELGTLPGFEGLWDAMHLRTRKAATDAAPFLMSGPLRVVFFWTHLNSTDGDTVYALDLSNRRIVRLSPNWATPAPVPDCPAFFTITSERYRPLGDGRTVNCAYLDYWDATLKCTRVGRDVPAVFYGAAISFGEKRMTIRYELPEPQS